MNKKVLLDINIIGFYKKIKDYKNNKFSKIQLKILR